MNIKDALNINNGYSVKDKPEFMIVKNYIINNGFNDNLKSLVLDMEMKKNYKSKNTEYDPLFNRINGPSSGDKFIHELFHMSSYNSTSEKMGIIGIAGFGKSLNEAITDYLTKSVSEEYKINYIYEVLFLESLSFIYPDVMKKGLKYYFDSNSKKFFNIFGEDKDIIVKGVHELDIYDIYKTNYKMGLKNKETINELIEHLTNAFSIIINNEISKNNENAIDILEDFEFAIENRTKEEYSDVIISSIENKIERGRSL